MGRAAGSRATPPAVCSVVCGRFTYLYKWKQLHRLMRLTTLPGDELLPRYNVAPTQDAPVVRQGADGARTGALLRWGLIPSWADDPAIGNRLINVRSESAASKFRAAVEKRRCLVPVSGFYEWQRIEGEKAKRPHYISRADDEPLALAGLWERWARGDDEVESFTILTTAANGLVKPMHDRMPVIVSSGDYDLWLDASVTDPSLVAPLLNPYEGGDLKAYQVSTRVNTPDRDDPVCIEPVGPQ